ncbi:MAG TPA: amino acid permease [Candidatus Angelobacter sp.]|jgi:APA family basic amino acid/polyamine antiporter|nr:amino acid permease [Candidatus Angelobacter sp.]
MLHSFKEALLASQLFARKSIDKLISDSENPEHRLKKTLGPWSLTALGIGAIIGSGIFVLTGTAAAGEFSQPSLLHAQVLDVFQNLFQHGNLSGVLMHGRPPAGPAIAISFLLVAIACAFAGLCYAELASMIPIAGSAYTYSYATLGELIAWIIGWDLILEYAVSNVAVAVGFGAYLKSQLAAFGLNIPDQWSTPVFAAGAHTGSYFNFPAFLIVFILTVLLLWGIRESAEANNIMVLVKIGAILTFLVVGGMLVNPSNWHPFAPSGFGGIVSGGAIIFFTYIGFDSVSTAAEEARNPQKDIPFGIIASLIICTVLYIGVALVLLGMMKYSNFAGGNAEAVNAPVAYALKHLGANRWFQTVIVIGALMGMISSLLVFQYGQTRIWFAMSRDGLLPKLFSDLHVKFKTPHWSTWIAGAAVGIPAGIVDIGEAADLSNIGTLFAFVLVSLGVLFLRRSQPDRPRGFKVPLVPLFPIISVVLCVSLMAGLLVITWIRFFAWLGIGLVIYFLYSRRHSEFASSSVAASKG